MSWLKIKINCSYIPVLLLLSVKIDSCRKYNAKMGVLVNTRFIKAVNDIQLVIQKKVFSRTYKKLPARTPFFGVDVVQMKC